MNENKKKEINIRAVEQGLRTSLELYRDLASGRVPASKEDKANVAQVIRNLCAAVCEYVELI